MSPRTGHGGEYVNSLCFSGDSGLVASGGEDGRVVICDASSGKQVHALENGQGRSWVNSVCFSCDGRRVASGGGNIGAVARVICAWAARGLRLAIHGLVLLSKLAFVADRASRS